MKKILFIVAFFAAGLITKAQLSGNYTIGGTSPNFLTINDAIDSLNTMGVSGPVTLSIRSGTYNEQFSINTIAGASSINTITLKSETNNAADVQINRDNSLASNYVIELFNTSFITIEHISFTVTTPNTSWTNGIIIYLSNVNDITVKHCILNGLAHIGSYNEESSIFYANQFSYYYNIHIENNMINNGSYGIDFRNGTPATNNIFISSNIITNPGGVGIYTYNIPHTVIITNNTINNNQPYNNVALFVQNCTSNLSVKNNMINVLISSFSIELYNCKGVFANNFIINSHSIGHALYLKSCTELLIHHNNFQSLFAAITIDSGNLDIEVFNNNFKTVNGSIFNCGSQPVTTAFAMIDYNNYHISGYGNIYESVVNVSCNAYSTTLYGFDVHSLSVDPFYASASDLHASNIILKNAGTGVGETVDIDSLPRNATTPTIGANEITPTSAPLSGTYSVGASGYFTSISQVLDSLKTLGISNNVIFELQAGSYTSQITLGKVAGLENPYTLTFRSATLNPNDVTITNSGNNILKLENTNNIRFEYLTFSNTTAVSGTKAIELLNGLKNINFSNNIFNFHVGQDIFYSQILQCINYTITDSIVITDNIFIGGKQSINLKGGSLANHSLNTIIRNNTFSGFSGNVITLEYQKSPIIERDSIDNTNSIAIRLIKCSEKIQIIKNKILGVMTAIQMDSCFSYLGNEGIVSNNFLNAGPPFGYGVYAIKLYQSTNQHIYHNSMNLIYNAMSFGGNTCFYSQTSKSCKVYNNIFNGQDWLFDIDTLDYFNYNNFDTPEPQIGKYAGTTYGTFTSFVSGTGTNAQSININPMYTSSSDLHANNLGLKLPNYLTTVPNDIDGIVRHTTHPFIGATEICKQPIASFISDTICLGDTAIFLNNSSNIDSLSVFYWDYENTGNIDTTSFVNVSYYYPTPASYYPELVIVNQNGCSDTLSQIIIVNDTMSLPAAFGSTISGDTVSFSDNTTIYTSWNWDFGDGFFSTTQNPTHIYSGPGSYYVCRTDINNCATATFCDSVIILSTLSIAESFSDDGVVLFPNPSNDKTTISINNNNSGPVSIYLYNNLGELIYKKMDHHDHKLELNISDLSNGVYQLLITSKTNKSILKKLIINK